jgi:hypothetical protein
MWSMTIGTAVVARCAALIAAMVFGHHDTRIALKHVGDELRKARVVALCPS